ncbi:hypothetical protein KSP39_PZI024282 [Platanthera zijinensis]|uniref:Uncharacterized protein n=1 Tax=Platanthera zijinensis TaxID=2320716 RepID=A0AAP0FTS3_9ASPA
MEAAKKKVMGLFAKQDNLINLFLAGVFAALSWRSHMQQEEIDALEAEKLALTSGNQAMSSAMWAWREHLFHLAEADPSSAHIPISRLRAIYGEEEMASDASPSDAELHRVLLKIGLTMNVSQ